MQEWKSVVGWEWKYLVSNSGGIRNILNGKLLTEHNSKKGYVQVNLVDSTNYPHNNRVVPVHKIVALAFIGPRPDGYTIHHIDRDKSNNNFSNLEYLPKPLHDRENKLGEANPQAKLTREQVKEIKELVSTGLTHRLVAARFGVSKALVGLIVTGKRWAWL